MDTCGYRYSNYVDNSTAIFEELTIIGTVPTPVPVPELDADDSSFFPLSSQVSIMPLESQEYEYSSAVQGDVTTHTLTLRNTDAELYGFALWGRVFATDGLDADPPVQEELEKDQTDSSTIHFLSPVLLLLALTMRF